jgi:hypothetical protein
MESRLKPSVTPRALGEEHIQAKVHKKPHYKLCAPKGGQSAKKTSPRAECATELFHLGGERASEVFSQVTLAV